MKCGDLLKCMETGRLAILITPDDRFGWIEVQWVDDGSILLVQNIAWENLTKVGQKLSSTDKLR